MCGISGFAGDLDRALLARMTDVITHRGPDDAGIWTSDEIGSADPIGLGNRRLSIIDLSAAGHMPMASDDGMLHLTYNGEVYNYRELRNGLIAKGHRFRSQTDTEVLIHLYQERGEAFLRELNGMFALALWDERHRHLLLARDRYGIKPLYYVQTPDRRLLFGSEIKSILQDPGVPREVNLEALDAFLRFGWVPGPQTMLRGIYKMPPGHYLIWRDGTIDVRQYWDIEFHEPTSFDEAALTAELRAILERAVKRHLVSDVPVGAFLSGGLDSSAIVGLASRITGEPVRAYTIAFRPEDARLEQAGQEDATHARLVAKHFGADYHEILVDPDIADLLPEVVYALDEPVADHAPILNLLIARAAYPEVKVLLTGQGADEIFGGYRVHLASQLAGWLGWMPRWLRDGALLTAVDALPVLPLDRLGVPPGRRLAAQRYLRRLLGMGGRPPDERSALARSNFSPDEQRGLYADSMRRASADFDATQWHRGYFAAAPGARGDLNRMLYTDLKTFLPELNLTYSDKLTAFASVEGRVPFLDNELVDFAARLPTSLKLHGATGKYLLRRAVEDLLPRSVLTRPKAGFGAPVRKWLRDELRPMIRDHLSTEAIQRRGYFDPAAVETLVRRNETGEDDQPIRVWALLCLEVWHRGFIDAPFVQPPKSLVVGRDRGRR